MHSFEAASTIAAAPKDVWAVLSDVASWPRWDSVVISVDGAIGQGARLAIRSEAAPQRAFAVKVTELRAPRRFGMYLPPLLEALGLAEVTHDPRNNSVRAV